LGDSSFTKACDDVLESTGAAGSGFNRNEPNFEERLSLTDFMNIYQNTRSTKKLIDFYTKHFAK